MKKTKFKKLSLEKMQIVKFDNLISIRGGDITGDDTITITKNPNKPPLESPKVPVGKPTQEQPKKLEPFF
jgi:hypothetical protein